LRARASRYPRFWRGWAWVVCRCRYHGTEDLHYANTPLLTKFVSRFGKILPKSQTHLSSKMQRKLARVIKCSRQAGLMPYKGTWNMLRCARD
jgi:ribosomal protein S18